jgi:pSer/pThr/pTyr-binding forkhead associated (FHA) protein
MRRADWLHIVLIAAALGAAAPLAAQEPAAEPPAPRPPVQTAEPRLVFEREVFSYPGRARRDPFIPLTSSAEGPLFSDLKLHMIIFVDDPNASIITVSDNSQRRVRLRRGESIGNATVIDIGPTRVVFSVNEFGIRRQEVLDLKKREGA